MGSGTRCALLLSGLLLGCGGAEDAPLLWQSLPRAWGGPTGLPPEAQGFRYRREEGSSLLWVDWSFAPGDWEPSGLPGIWRLPLPLVGQDRFRDAASGPRLWVGEQEYIYVPTTDLDFGQLAGELDNAMLEARFSVAQEALFLSSGAGEPPRAGRVSVPLERGAREDGAWRLSLGRHAADALSVWPGESALFELDVPAHSALQFAFAAQRWLPTETRVVFRVLWNGELLHEGELLPERGELVQHQRVLLPAEGGRDVQLALEVDGDACESAFLVPRIAPAQHGRPGARPWDESSPDLVLFVADTLRADALSGWGGRGLAPALDAFAAESERYTHAWSTSSWTLPAHGSMFTGLFPREHGAVESDRGLHAAAHTLAEHLRGHGYRTVAVTDRGFVSREFGLDQGFEWFHAEKRAPSEMLRMVEELLAQDDGRPLFLFAHTYRVHEPYEASPEARARLAPEHADLGEFHSLMTALEAGPPRWKTFEPVPQSARAQLARLQALYDGGVVDLDRAFGELRGLLEDAGVLPGGYLLVTSDHGEAFGEHEYYGHGVGVWEELARVPLILGGGGIRAREVRAPVSLVDLPRTFASLAGVAPHEAWGGRSIFEEDAGRPVFVYQCARAGRSSQAALVVGERKLFLEEGEGGLRSGSLPTSAYDLASDPGEQLDAIDAAWVRQLLAEHGPQVAERSRLVLPLQASHLPASARSELDQLGYGGD